MKRASRALESRRRVSAPAQEAPTDERPEDLPLVGRTPVMQGLYRLVARVMNADMPVLLTGESGTGKSLIARAIHDFSDRRTLPFVTVSAADLRDIEGPARVLARARGGSLLIDEVADFGPEVQARIVRMMDTPGEHAPRFMATSQIDLMGAIEAGRMRQDLYYRLSGAVITVPALRDRVDDIELLTKHFFALSEREGTPPRRLGPEAQELFRVYSWPGNVRQLENAVRRLVLTSRAEDITRAEAQAVLGGQPEMQAAPSSADGDKLSASVARHLRRYFDLHGAMLPPPGLHTRILREVELPLIEIALDATGGNQAKCADLLGINRNTLRKKITDLDIQVTRRRKLM